MWWVDDTANPDGSAAAAPNLQIYSTTTSDPLNWSTDIPALNHGAFVALDVKYDARADAFIQIAVPWVSTTGPYGGLSAIPTKYSYDGVTWEWGRDCSPSAAHTIPVPSSASTDPRASHRTPGGTCSASKPTTCRPRFLRPDPASDSVRPGGRPRTTAVISAGHHEIFWRA